MSMKQTPQITAVAAAALVKNNGVLLVGGFGMIGNPVHLLHALAERQNSGKNKDQFQHGTWAAITSN